jgi:ABC-2 type transport system ATP-binding protein
MIELEDVCKAYGPQPVLDRARLRIERGQVVAVVGRSGSGKTTLVKHLNGLLTATSGRVLLDGGDIRADILRYKSSLGYVPEEPHLYSYLTGIEYLRLIGELRHIRPAVLETKIERFIELLGLADDRYLPLSSYSKGMRQKILIAAAVLHNPRIVVLDEPFSGLDVSTARTLKQFVRHLIESGKLVVFSSHVLEVVEQVCSRVVILKDGRAVGADSVANLRRLLELPTLDAVFARVVSEENTDDASRALVEAMET